jgi:hypothetical protein
MLGGTEAGTAYTAVVPGRDAVASPGPITTGKGLAKTCGYQPVLQLLLWLWVPDLRAAMRRLSGTTME